MRRIVAQETEVRPCQRCGQCCREEICRVGEAVFKTSKSPCPGLVKRNRNWACLLAEICPSEFKFFFSLVMGFGCGCDMDAFERDETMRKAGEKAISGPKTYNGLGGGYDEKSLEMAFVLGRPPAGRLDAGPTKAHAADSGRGMRYLRRGSKLARGVPAA